MMCEASIAKEEEKVATNNLQGPAKFPKVIRPPNVSQIIGEERKAPVKHILPSNRIDKFELET